MNRVQAFGMYTVIQSGWDCVPCERSGCGGSKPGRCLEDIKPEEVLAIIGSRLDVKNQGIAVMEPIEIDLAYISRRKRIAFGPLTI